MDMLSPAPARRLRACPRGALRLMLWIACALCVSGRGTASAAPAATAPAAAPDTATARVVGRALRVVVTVPPLKGLVEPLLPDGSTLIVLVPVGVSEHSFEVPPSRLVELSKADIVVTVGMGLEPQVDKWLANRPNGRQALVRFESLVPKQDAGVKADGDSKSRSDPASHDHADHDHARHDHSDAGHDCNDEHHDHSACGDGSGDPHLWLDPVLAKSLVDEVAVKVIAACAPATDGVDKGPDVNTARTRETVEKARTAMHARLDALDAEFKSLAAQAANRPFIVGHDAYGRWTARYGLKTIALAGMHASEPTPGNIQKAITAIAALKAEGTLGDQSGAGSVYVEPQLARGAAERISKATGATIREIDPLGDGDYLKMMHANIESLRASLPKPPASAPATP